MFGFPKMIKKQDMTQEMLELRQQVLNDTVEFMVFVDKYNLPLSVKSTFTTNTMTSKNGIRRHNRCSISILMNKKHVSY